MKLRDRYWKNVWENSRMAAKTVQDWSWSYSNLLIFLCLMDGHIMWWYCLCFVLHFCNHDSAVLLLVEIPSWLFSFAMPLFNSCSSAEARKILFLLKVLFNQLLAFNKYCCCFWQQQSVNHVYYFQDKW